MICELTGWKSVPHHFKPHLDAFLQKKLSYKPLPVNTPVWEQLYSQRGAETSRDKRRCDYAIAASLKAVSLDDRSVIKILDALASRAPQTAVQVKVRRICKALLTHEGPDRTSFLTRAGTPCEALMALMSMKVDPHQYNDAFTYFWDNQLVKLLSKYPFKGCEGREQAIDHFLACERINEGTNARWASLTSNSPLVRGVRRRLSQILGKVPDIESVIIQGGWGPGTHSGYPLKSDETGPEFKFSVKPTLTPNLIPLVGQVMQSLPVWDRALRSIFGRQNRFETVEGSVLFTVPKKFLMDRVAMAEPMVNSYLQLGVAAIMRQRFRRATGVDLKLSWRTNQELARIGSVAGIFATGDLSNASDMVCRGPLWKVLPTGWYGLLASLASRSCLLPDTSCSGEVNASKDPPKYHRFQMMSSMGNGFTFELETILFYAMLTSIVPGIWTAKEGRMRLEWPHVSVFGDDLVYPSAYHESVKAACAEFGFILNDAKSFSSGSFRESCGSDFFNGVGVRPLRFSKRLDNGAQVVEYANRILAMAFEDLWGRGYHHGLGDDRWAGAWTTLRGFIPGVLRALISTPPHVPSGLWGVGSESTWETALGIPPRYRVIIQEPVQVRLHEISQWCPEDRYFWPFKCNGENLLAARLSQIGVSPEMNKWADPVGFSKGNAATLRSSVTYKVSNRAVVDSARWLSLGPIMAPK